MFFKILKKDLKRKKSMNLLLFLFLIMTSMLLGTSINMLTTVTSASDQFVKQAKMPDFIGIVFTDKNSDQILHDWLDNNEIAKESYIQENIIITANMMRLPKRCGVFEYDNMLGLEVIPNDVNLVFDENDQPLKVGEGEIAIPYFIKDQTGLKIGDKMSIEAYGVKKEFKIVHYVKDAFTGSSLLGYKRIFISENAYHGYENEATSKINNVCVNVKEGHKISELQKQFSKLSINSLSTITRSMYGMLYMMEMIVAAIMAVVSVFLIIIAFILLRFTIMFTVQEDYKQIGIMKAIGLKDRAIKSIYLVKYLVLSLIGGVIGYIISIPLGAYMIDVSCKMMVIKKDSYINGLSILGVCAIIALTILFCMRCTNKIAKVSAIEAIRNGSNGERFTKLSRIALHNKKRLGVSSYLAFSDIANHARKYTVLFITFILGTMILLVPINLINTMRDKSMMKLFGQPKVDTLVVPKNATEIIYTYSMDQLKDLVKELNEKYQKADVPVELFLDVNYMSKVYKDDKDDSKTIYTSVAYGIDKAEYPIEEGEVPELENEVAITKDVAKEFDVSVGDTIHINVCNQEKEFIVTGIYEAMINMGSSIRLNGRCPMTMDGCAGFNIFGRFTETGKDSEIIESMKPLDRNVDVKDCTAYLDGMLGSTVQVLDALRYMVLVVILVINFLITMLIVRMMITKETAEIAILKSIGFKNRTIRGWQVKRMLYILVISVIVGTILVALFGSNITLIVFKMMGVTKMSLVIKPFEVFLLYPGIIMVDIAVAVLISTMDLKRIKVWEVNNQE